jgi:hypothetical protein
VKAAWRWLPSHLCSKDDWPGWLQVVEVWVNKASVIPDTRAREVSIFVTTRCIFSHGCYESNHHIETIIEVAPSELRRLARVATGFRGVLVEKVSVVPDTVRAVSKFVTDAPYFSFGAVNASIASRQSSKPHLWSQDDWPGWLQDFEAS